MNKILDMGIGSNQVPNSVSMDIDPALKPDILHDFNRFPYPVESNTFEKIYAKHIIEHVDDPEGFLKEIFRILKPDGIAYIETPHFSNYVAYSDPQHKRFCSYFMLRNITQKLNIKVIKHEITFYKTFRMFGIKYLANKSPLDYERFWTYIFPAECVVMEFKKIS